MKISLSQPRYLPLPYGLPLARQIHRALGRMNRAEPVPYVLYGPPYRHNSAGVRALHRLVHLLNERGYPAYTRKPGNPDWNEPLLKSYRHFIEPIVIYPEIVTGNPMQARRVVRWLLNAPGYLGGNKNHDDSELVFTWSRHYADIENVLEVDIVERELFCLGAKMRDGDRYYMGKGLQRGATLAKLTEGLEEITSTYPPTRAGLADLLQRTRTLYLYDDHTALSMEGGLCGCRVILLPENVELAVLSTPEEDLRTCEAQLKNFITLTQRFGAAI